MVTVELLLKYQTRFMLILHRECLEREHIWSHINLMVFKVQAFAEVKQSAPQQQHTFPSYWEPSEAVKASLLLWILKKHN